MFVQGGQVATNTAKGLRSSLTAEAARNLLLHLDHVDVLFGLIVNDHNVMKWGEESLKLRFMGAHLHGIQQLPDLDAEGYEIAQHYLQGYQEKLFKQLQATIDTITWMIEFVSRMA